MTNWEIKQIKDKNYGLYFLGLGTGLGIAFIYLIVVAAIF
jgi:hypothetical protein